MTDKPRIEFHVVRDQGYDRRSWRIYDTRAEAEAGMAKWQREGIEGSDPALINAGEWRIEVFDLRAERERADIAYHEAYMRRPDLWEA